MIVWTPTVFECLIRMRFLFSYLHLFSAIEHVSHGKSALEICSLLLLLCMYGHDKGNFLVSHTRLNKIPQNPIVLMAMKMVVTIIPEDIFSYTSETMAM